MENNSHRTLPVYVAESLIWSARSSINRLKETKGDNAARIFRKDLLEALAEVDETTGDRHPFEERYHLRVWAEKSTIITFRVEDDKIVAVRADY